MDNKQAELPLVSVRSLGGTVAMTTAEPGRGASPSVSASDLVESIPALQGIARIDAASVAAVPSASLEFGQLLDLAAELERACVAGATGAVVTQGTDTMEETAFLLDLVWDRPEPLVVTGAMRTADSVGADGPANLLAAVTTAADPLAAGRGCLVVMNDEIHAARTVHKAHTASVAAFASPGTGPVGRVQEGRVLFQSTFRRTEPFDMSFGNGIARVALLRLAFAGDTVLLETAAGSYDGIVIEGMGGGHVPTWWVEPLLAAAQQVPVVLGSRTGAGHVLSRTYGYPGSEQQLLGGGLIPAGDLDGLKARILLTLAVSTSSDRDSARKAFEQRVASRTNVPQPIPTAKR